MESDKFKKISASSAGKKFGVDKTDIDMLNLPYIEVPNPYYQAKSMKLYYEFMIEKGLDQIKQWKVFKKEKQKE